MCGLTGFLNFKGNSGKAELLSFVKSMSHRIEHRGPDSSGTWCDERRGLAFGHQRLAIVDLSEAGHQPMISQSDRSVIVYNGEIYNAPELRAQLISEGCQFRGHSDTEVILEACERWGVKAACQKFIGMFAFAFWDKGTQELFLGRDRLGIKPLYWGFNQGIFFFGSQIKSFAGHPAWRPEIDKSALTAYFRFNYVPTPVSIYKGISKLGPGTVLSLDVSKNIKTEKFWDLEEVNKNNIRHISDRSDEELLNQCDNLLKDAVKRRMIADVPLGAFLSGGVDSSLVVALMQSQSTRPIQTFTIGFHESGYNEAKYAETIAKHLKTEHHELYVTSAEAQAVVPNIPSWCDEPFADASQIPTYLVSKLARQQVTVSLSGDGGDELFAGYNRYLGGRLSWDLLKFFPFWMRSLSAKGIHQLSVDNWNSLGRLMPKFFPSMMGDKAYKLATAAMAEGPYHFYKLLVSQWGEPASLVLGGEEKSLYPWKNLKYPLDYDQEFVEAMQIMDTLSYLPDDILTKVDRASMAVGLEARVPLLDHRVVEFAFNLPRNAKIRNGQGKWLLRQVLDRYVPRHLIDRPKMGFGLPIDKWLRGPLREWAEELLSTEKINAQGLLNTNPIRQRWKEHLSGERNWQNSLWGVLMFQAWYERWHHE